MPQLTLYKKFYWGKKLYDAWNNLRKNPSSSGLSGQTIEQFGQNLHNEIEQLRFQLKNNSFKFSKVKGSKYYKSTDPSDFRPLKIPEVRDRVVIRAIVNTISPILENKFELKNRASYAYQKGLGPPKAFERVISLYKSGRRIILEADIIKFFDSVDKEKLLNDFILPSLPDDSLNNLLIESLSLEIGNQKSFNQEELKLFEMSNTGIPQGSSLSPLLSNVYLSSFDKLMINEGFGLVRYADDFVVLCKTLSEAKKAYRIAKEVLENELKLKIYPLDNSNKNSKTKIINPTQNPLNFLSIIFNGNDLYPSREKYLNLKKNLMSLSSDKNLNVIDYLMKFRLKLIGWIASFHFTNVERYFEDLEKFINENIAFGLNRRKWKLKKLAIDKKSKYSLNEFQRIFSGVSSCAEILKNIRR